MLILPDISSAFTKSSKAYTYFPYMDTYTSYTPPTIISLPLPYQHRWACNSMVLAYPSNRSTIQIEERLNSFQKLFKKKKKKSALVKTWKQAPW